MYRVNYLYPFLVWFLTVITAPIILGLSLMTEFSSAEVDHTISFIGLGIAMSAGLSLPTLFVYYVGFLLFSQTTLPAATQKLILALTAILGLMVTFYVIGLNIFEFTSRDMVLPLSYIVSVFFFSFLFPIHKRSAVQEDVNTINNLPEDRG